MKIIQPINTNVDISTHTHTHTHTHTNLLNGGKADLTDYGKSLPSLQEIQLQLHALTDNPVDIVVNEDVTVRAESKNLTPTDSGSFGFQPGAKRISDGSSYKDFFEYKNYPHKKEDHMGYIVDLAEDIYDMIATIKIDTNKNLIIETNSINKYDKIIFIYDEAPELKCSCKFTNNIDINGKLCYQYVCKNLDNHFVFLFASSAGNGFLRGTRMLFYP